MFAGCGLGGASYGTAVATSSSKDEILRVIFLSYEIFNQEGGAVERMRGVNWLPFNGLLSLLSSFRFTMPLLRSAPRSRGMTKDITWTP